MAWHGNMTALARQRRARVLREEHCFGQRLPGRVWRTEPAHGAEQVRSCWLVHRGEITMTSSLLGKIFDMFQSVFLTANLRKWFVCSKWLVANVAFMCPTRSEIISDLLIFTKHVANPPRTVVSDISTYHNITSP